MSEPPFEQARRAFFDGLRCQQAGDCVQAEQHYLDSLRCVPGRPSTLVNLAATQLQLGRPAEALRHAEQALAVEPDSADALWHRAAALAELGRLDAALPAYERLLAHAPAHAAGWRSKGDVLRELGRADAAAVAYRQALACGADPTQINYYLAAVTGSSSPAAPPEAYVERLFDRYADDFDHHLVDLLHYEGHVRLVEALAALGRAPFESAADLGCGTGLCGALVRPLLRPIGGALIGVDLSAAMLSKAGALGCYDRLEQADAVAYLERSGVRHDLLLAADVLIYIGDLAPLLAAARSALDADGVFCFSVEAASEPGATFVLRPSLRYAHARPYVIALAATHGFDVLSIAQAPLRREQAGSIDGLFICLAASRHAGSAVRE